jgi:hypothetical protein
VQLHFWWLARRSPVLQYNNLVWSLYAGVQSYTATKKLAVSCKSPVLQCTFLAGYWTQTYIFTVHLRGTWLVVCTKESSLTMQLKGWWFHERVQFYSAPFWLVIERKHTFLQCIYKVPGWWSVRRSPVFSPPVGLHWWPSSADSEVGTFVIFYIKISLQCSRPYTPQ